MSDSYTNALYVDMADTPSQVDKSVNMTMSYGYSHVQ